jgi:hypothetical protein
MCTKLDTKSTMLLSLRGGGGGGGGAGLQGLPRVRDHAGLRGGVLGGQQRRAAGPLGGRLRQRRAPAARRHPQARRPLRWQLPAVFSPQAVWNRRPDRGTQDRNLALSSCDAYRSSSDSVLILGVQTTTRCTPAGTARPIRAHLDMPFILVIFIRLDAR